jgi:uncharacterized membrane protein
MPNTPVSPKVKAGANWAAYATFALTLLSTITPSNLSFLGAYAPLAYGVVIGATYAVGAYLKADPLRDAGAASEASTVNVVNLAPAAAPEVTAPVVIAPEVAPAETPAQ